MIIFLELENMRPLTKFGLFKEFTVLLVLGIVVPTSDVYSDWALTYQLLTEPAFFQCPNGSIIKAKFAKSWTTYCEDGSERE